MDDTNMKTDYLMRSFRNTVKKDRENYVVLGIWHRLRSGSPKVDLKPVTQQLVRRPGGGHALLDLYFPAIKLAVECDEAFHLKNYESDRAREADIFKAFAECGIGGESKHVISVRDEEATDAEKIDVKTLELARVDASVDYAEIDSQLDFIASRIRERYAKAGCPKWDNRMPEEIVVGKGFVDVDDDLIFRKMTSVIAALGIKKADDTDYKRWDRGSFPVRDSGNTYLWFPHISFDAGGWKNRLMDNGETIHEARGTGDNGEEESTHKRAKNFWLKMESDFKSGITVTRAVFAYNINALGESGYRFMGVYELADVVREAGEDAPTRLVWRKTSSRFECV